MRIRYTACLLASVLLASIPSLAETCRVGTMDFYGLGKITEGQVRTALDMLNSVVWTDRNKASMILSVLTEGGDAALLQQIHNSALPSLVEMARWKNLGHAGVSFFLLGRMAGVTDAEVEEARQHTRLGTGVHGGVHNPRTVEHSS